MAKLRKPTDKQLLEDWRQYYESFISDVEVDTGENEADKLKRIKRLEADPEQWFKYYFPAYCTAEPAAFHKAATKRLTEHRRWYEVRAWSRELAKSARSMMEILYLALTGQVSNVLVVSNSYDNACRLLLPFQIQLEKNARIINDYGDQVNPGNWETGQFVAKCGCSFRAIGAGQSPRGTRNEAKRPDFILVDDIDTDEECRNPDRIAAKWDWIEQALIPTVSVSGDVRILFNGNIIAKTAASFGPVRSPTSSTSSTSATKTAAHRGPKKTQRRTLISSSPKSPPGRRSRNTTTIRWPRARCSRSSPGARYRRCAASPSSSLTLTRQTPKI